MTKTTAAATASARRGTSQRLAGANPSRGLNTSDAPTGASPLANSRSSQSLMRASFQMREPPLQRLVGAIEARRHSPHRAPHHTGNLLVRQSLGVTQHYHDPLLRDR